MQMSLQCLFFPVRHLNKTVALGKCPAMTTQFCTVKIEHTVMLSIHTTVAWLQTFGVPQDMNPHHTQFQITRDSSTIPHEDVAFPQMQNGRGLTQQDKPLNKNQLNYSVRSYKVISEKHPWRHASLCHSCSGNGAYLLHINCSELGSDASWVQDGIPVCIGFKGNMSVTARDRMLLPKAKLLLKETKFCDNDISKKPQPNKKIPAGNSVSQKTVVPNYKSSILHIILF